MRSVFLASRGCDAGVLGRDHHDLALLNVFHYLPPLTFTSI